MLNIKPFKTLVFVLLLFILPKINLAQKVGLVMSGGGAAGMIHVGVIKALEEHGIPIDYITGTSAGALIGSMYVTGHSPEQMEHMVKSEEMLNMSKGYTNSQYNYFFKKKDPTPAIVNFKLDKNLSLTKLLPLNFTDPSLVDFHLMQIYSVPTAHAKNDFDSLFIPFRCVAADIDHNVDVTLKDGHLSQAVRASMSFPFYLPAITIDDQILLDGGLYNNFPVDVMYEEFLPDFIIGSSATSVRKKPLKDDLLTQVRSMLQTKSNFDFNCEEGILIEPNVDDIMTFDFEDREEAMKRGYDETIKMMDSIKSYVSRRSDRAQLAKKRALYFRNTKREIRINKIEVTGVGKRQESYIRSVLKDKNRNVSLMNLKPRYFKLILDDKIKFIFPVLVKNPNDEYYTLHLEVRKEPQYDVSIGGTFSSRSINTGFVGIDFKLIDKYFAMTTSANTHFGRFYSSLDVATRLDFPLDLPFYIEPFVTLNRWDYYRSFSAFFEDTKPSFLIKSETFWGISVGVPSKNNGKLKLTYKNGVLDNEYYQTSQFLSTDTSDNTEFFFDNISLNYEYNTLDNLSYSKKGKFFKASVNYITGIEINKPGSTSAISTDTANRHNYLHDWLTFKARYEQYFSLGLDYKLGIEFEGVHSTQKFFNNYTASTLIAPQYNPTQEAKTLFIPEHTAHTYLAAGLKNVFPLYSTIDLRVEGYVFQPYRSILGTSNQEAFYSPRFKDTERRYILSTALVFNSPLGPASLRANYMDHRDNKWSVMFNFNYTLFNRKALD